MVNPIDLLNFRVKRVPERPRTAVEVPTAAPSTDALFVVLRRMRRPFVFVIVAFSICTVGMTLMPGKTADGEFYRLTFFDAFYQMAITLTTVGYSEVPYSFSYPQRMWLTLSIFLLVVAWAYAIGAFFSVLQEPAFRDALSAQRFRRRVAHLREPFVLVAGYGQAGRTVGLELDLRRRRFVVVDLVRSKVDRLLTDPLAADVPGLEGDVRDPAVLGLAGLGSPHCVGVLALTDDDEANLSVLMTTRLLRPDLEVYVRCQDRALSPRMEDFGPTALINPHDRYGGYLALAAQRPVVHQLLTWLMENDQPKLMPLWRGLADGRWVICGSGPFADEVVADLADAGLRIERLDPDDDLDLDDAVVFIAGTDNDVTNIALAEHARMDNPNVFVAVRQLNSRRRPLLAALGANSVFVPTDLVARETLARIVTPTFWFFVEEAVQRDDEWARRIRDRLVVCTGDKVPERDMVTISERESPALAAWLQDGHGFTVADLVRHPDDRETELPVTVLGVLRAGEFRLTPPGQEPLEVGDRLLLAGSADGLADLSDVLFSPAAVEYLATGREVPATWLWRTLSRRLRTTAEA